MPERVEQALETIGLTALAHRPAGILAHGQKQWLEVGMLLVQDAKVMFLDETVAGMSADEREETGELLQRIVGDRTIVVIEHDMEFMRTLRRLRDGHARRQGARRGDGRRDPGRPAGPRGLPGNRGGGGRRWLSRCSRSSVSPRATGARWSCSTSTCRSPSAAAAAVMGHNGAGKTTLLRVAVGLIPVKSGKVLLDGEDVTKLAPQPAGQAAAWATSRRASSASRR